MQSLKETHSYTPSFNIRRANVRHAKLRRASGDPPSFSKKKRRKMIYKNTDKGAFDVPRITFFC